MARSRNLKPGFFTNDLLAEVLPLGRLLFQGLWCHSDREGRIEDRPKKLKAEILPYDECDVDALLDALAERDFITRYAVGETRFIQCVKFSKHQNPHIKEPASTIPAPDSPDAKHQNRTRRTPDNNRSGPADSLLPITDSLNPRTDSLSPSTPFAASEKISLSAEGVWQGITPERRTLWAAAYPAVDLDAELASAAAWAVENPKNKKSNWGRFITAWLKRAQDRAPAKGNGKHPPKAVTCDFRGDPYQPEREPCGMGNAKGRAFYGGRPLCQHHTRELEDRDSPKTTMPDAVRDALAGLVKRKVA